MNRIGLLTLCGAMALASAAAAQTAPACAGTWQVIRLSKVKAGKMDLFMRAMKDQQAWYSAKGLPDRITYGAVVSRGGDASPDMVVTVHDKAAADGPSQANDAKWDAFVAEFRDSSDIVSGGPSCMVDAPK